MATFPQRAETPVSRRDEPCVGPSVPDLRRSTRGFRPSLVGWSTVALGLLAAGCGPGKSPTSAPVANAAKVLVANLTNYDWQITVTARRGGKTRSTSFAARATGEVNVPGGDYEIEQTALTGQMGTAASRHFAVRLEPGQTYRWSLATLLSATDESERTPEIASP